MPTDSWVNETLYPDWGQRFRVKRELAHVQSDFQDIMIFESYSHGRVMLLDGVTQITEMDEFVYQEMLTHVPILAHGAAKRVLIIGGGDGGMLRAVAPYTARQFARAIVMPNLVPPVTSVAPSSMALWIRPGVMSMILALPCISSVMTPAWEPVKDWAPNCLISPPTAAPVAAALVGFALLWIALFLVLPLVVVVQEAFARGAPAFLAALREPDALAAIRLTLLVAAVAVPPAPV